MVNSSRKGMGSWGYKSLGLTRFMVHFPWFRAAGFRVSGSKVQGLGFRRLTLSTAPKNTCWCKPVRVNPLLFTPDRRLLVYLVRMGSDPPALTPLPLPSTKGELRAI